MIRRVTPNWVPGVIDLARKVNEIIDVVNELSEQRPDPVKVKAEQSEDTKAALESIESHLTNLKNLVEGIRGGENKKAAPAKARKARGKKAGA